MFDQFCMRNGCRAARWLAALVAGLLAVALAAPAAAQTAAISVVDTSSGTSGVSSGGSDGNDYPISGTLPFMVSSNANALVVQYGEFAQANTGPDANPIIEWNGVPLTQGIVQVSYYSSYVYADIYYLMNPTPGVGSLTVSGSGRSYAMGAYTLSGVNTAIAPSVLGEDNQIVSGVCSVTLPGTTTTGSFAAVAETDRTNNLDSLPKNFTLSATSGTAVQLWSLLDTGPSKYIEGGGGYVTNLSAGATTITATNVNGASNRQEMAVAVFTPIAANGTCTWTGATNGNWSLAGSGANWSGAGSTYTDGSAVIFQDSAQNTNISISGSGVRPAMVTFTNNTTPYTFSGGGISALAIIALNGSGSVTFNSANTYSGGTTINAGVLTAGNNTALGTGIVSVGASGTVNFMTAAPSIGGLGGAGSIVLGSAAGQVYTNLTVNNGGNNSFSGVISESAPGLGSLNMTGFGTLTLLGANTYSGATTISGGTLALGNSLALQQSTLDTSGSGVLSLGSLAAVTLGGLAGPGTLALSNAASAAVALTVGNNNANTTYSGMLQGSGSLSKVGNGTLLLSGSNSYTGSTAVNAGTLQAAGTAAVPGYATPGTITVGSGAVLAVSAGGGGWAAADISTLLSSNGSGFASGSSLGIDTSGGSLSYNSNIAGSMGLTKLGGNMLILTGSNTYPGQTVVTAGTLQIGNGGASGIVAGNITDNGTLAFSRSDTVTFNNVISGTGSVVQVGPGTLLLSGSNTYTGSTTISGGTLALGNSMLLQQSTLGISDGGTLNFGSLTAATFGGLAGPGTLSLSNSSSGAVALSVGNNNVSTTFSGAMGGLGSLSKVGSGTLLLSGSNSYAGTTSR